MILVTGGAGYIGSHMVEYLVSKGHQVIVLDNLSNGYADAVIGTKLIVGDLNDRIFLEDIFSTHNFQAVIHFAGSIEVAESVNNPAKYLKNNFLGTFNLLEVMRQYQVQKFIFSSTAAIFGKPKYLPIDENHPIEPINPYGSSKAQVETMLKYYAEAYGIRSVCLRYFNAAGAHPRGILGERHNPETHLIPIILQAAKGIREEVKIYGQDYDTRDGTCIRDYIHVFDLCEAHLLSLKYLESGGMTESFNLGNGVGYSVLEIIKAVEFVTQKKIKVQHCDRRPGDPSSLIADSKKIKSMLGWEPSYPSINTIVEHAWAWHQRN